MGRRRFAGHGKGFAKVAWAAVGSAAERLYDRIHVGICSLLFRPGPLRMACDVPRWWRAGPVGLLYSNQGERVGSLGKDAPEGLEPAWERGEVSHLGLHCVWHHRSGSSTAWGTFISRFDSWSRFCICRRRANRLHGRYDMESRSGPSETVFLSRTVSHVHGFLRTRHARHVSYVFENATRLLGTGRGSHDRHCQSWSARRRHSDRTYLGPHRQAQVDWVRTRTGDADRPIVGVLAHNRFAGCGSVPAAIHSTRRMGCRPGSHFGTGARSYSWVSAGVCVSVRNTARRQCDLPGSGLCRPNQLFQCHGADRACRFCRYGHHHRNRPGEKRRPVRLGTLTNPRLRHLYRHAEMTLLIMTNATTRSSSVMVCRVSSTLSVLPSFRRCFAVATSTRFGKQSSSGDPLRVWAQIAPMLGINANSSREYL